MTAINYGDSGWLWRCKMNYKMFLEGLQEYYKLYEKGLKKQANKYIENYVNKFSECSAEEIEAVMFSFSKELCDDNKYNFMEIGKRGNGRIPYCLDVYLREYLYNECLKNRMPHLRWYYELYRKDRIGVEYAFDMLKKAYQSKECDEKTVVLMFEYWLELLAWGSHHFPDGCIIKKETAENAIKECEKIISEKEIDDKLRTELVYFKKLYLCYYKFEAEGRIKEFNEYCIEENIEYI